MSGVPPGQHNYGAMRLSRHAFERFVERFRSNRSTPPTIFGAVFVPNAPAQGAIRTMERSPCLLFTATARLWLFFSTRTSLTVLTWNQFVPRLAEFGRQKFRASGGDFAPAVQRGLIAMHDAIRKELLAALNLDGSNRCRIWSGSVRGNGKEGKGQGSDFFWRPNGIGKES